jgi:hypothetical protein
MANQDPNRDRQDINVEEPGDTNSADIVGRTGEQMPLQSHDGLEADVRDGTQENDEDEDPAATAADRSPDNPRAGRVSDW